MSIRDIVRDRLLSDMLGHDNIERDKNWKVLIVDEVSIGIISAACRVRDIMQKNVTLVENIAMKRQPFPQLSGIYLISPTRKSVQAVIDDFKDKKQYACAHIFFTARASNKIITTIKESKALADIKTLAELNMDFLAIEPKVFSLNQGEDMEFIYSEKSAEDKKKIAEVFADQLLTVCLSLGQTPFIRYNRTEISENISASLSKKLSNAAKGKLKLKQDAILIIVDRSVDPLAPLLHEFTYQAMAYDLMKLGTDGIYEYAYKDGSEKEQKKKVMLDEYDPLWIKYRHKHIDPAIKSLTAEFNEFLSQNKDISKLQGKEAKEKAAKDTKAISALITKLPQYQEMLSKYSMHLGLVREIMNKFKKENLAKIALLEQNMAVGKDPEGNNVTSESILTLISPHLRDSACPLENKMRLVMIYLITQGGMKDEKRTKLMSMAKFSPAEEAIINSLSKIGVQLTKNTTIASKILDLFKGGKKKKETEVDYDLSRYICKVKEIAEECIKNSLSKGEYPFISSEPPSSFKLSEAAGASTRASKKTAEEEEGEGVSLRSRKNASSVRKRGSERPGWEGESATTTSPSASSSSEKKSNKKLIICVIGGMTHSEMRAAYDLEEEYGLDVYVGSTSVLTPKLFIDKLAALAGQNSYGSTRL